MLTTFSSSDFSRRGKSWTSPLAAERSPARGAAADPAQQRTARSPGCWLTHVAFFVLTPLEVVLLRQGVLPALGIPMIALFLLAGCCAGGPPPC